MKTVFIRFFLMVSLFFGCQAQTTKNYKSVFPKVFLKIISETKKPQIVDVRSPEEYASGYIENAININWNSDNFDELISKLDKKKPLFVYCMSGGRSKKAANKLVTLGFNIIYELDGGIVSWKTMNLPTLE